MSVCKNCRGSGWQKVKEGVDEFGNMFEESIMCPQCYGTGNTPATNADRIRAMADEELAVFLWEFEKEEIARATEYALERRKITEWLKQPVEE